jgi:hypothetical protein
VTGVPDGRVAAVLLLQVQSVFWTPSLGGCELRKAISTLVVACAFVAGASGVAQAASAHAKPTRCGTKYTPSCTTPKITNKALSPNCVDAGPSYKLPTFTFVSNAGIKKIQVSLGSQTIKVITFPGQGKTQYSLNNVLVPTKGLQAGPQSVSVEVTDIANKSVSRTLRFSICQAKPVFTG